jgi:hypothetical protein
MCCGQKRSQLQSRQALGPAPKPAQRLPQYIPGNGLRQAVRSSLPPQTPAAPQPTRINPPSQGAPPAPPSPASTPADSITIRYLQAAAVRVQGLTTGRSYEFSASQQVQNVDARDASSLLSTPFFSRA